jgi:predicted enzyme related to lactoylglutathione lyase
MIGTMQPEVMTKFYTEVFGKPMFVDGDWSGWQVGSSFFTVGKHSEMSGPAKDPGRVMFNLESKEVKVEFDRIQKVAGVKVVKAPYEMVEGDNNWIATLADPDGNYFQLMTPWEGAEGESD